MSKTITLDRTLYQLLPTVEKNYCIYSIICTVNGKRYIGSSEVLPGRFIDHSKKLRNNRHPIKDMQDDYNKYGMDAFQFEMLQEYNDCKNRLKIEKSWMEHFETYKRDKGYNYKEQMFRRWRRENNITYKE